MFPRFAVCNLAEEEGDVVHALLYTNSPVVTSGLVAVLAPEEDIHAVLISGGVPELMRETQRVNPSVLMIEMTPDFDCAILGELQRKCPDTKVVLWVQSISMELAHRAMALGVRGILRKASPNELLVRCLRKVSEGELWFERTLLNHLLGVKKVRLSPREGQLLRLVSLGFSNKQLATTLGIAEGTVKVYLSRLFRKVGVNDRFELALYGLRNMVVGVGESSNGASEGAPVPNLLLLRNSVNTYEASRE
jgi:DNA-binding NarL/FixJ family response regulator